MKKQPTVLLVRGIEMPRRIAEHLRPLGVHVEQASPAALAAVLAAFRLELIVIGLSPAATAREPILLAVQKALLEAKLAVPLVALADWNEETPPGARAHVHAVVPIDLPDLAIAHRLKALAERASSGECLDKRARTAEVRPSDHDGSVNQVSPSEPQTIRRPLVPRAKPINRRPLPRGEVTSPVQASALQEQPLSPSRPPSVVSPSVRPPSVMPPSTSQRTTLSQPSDPRASVSRRFSPPPPKLGPASAPPRPRRRTTPPPTTSEAEKIKRLCEEWEDGDPHNRLSDWLFQAGGEIPARDTEPPLSDSVNATVRPGAICRSELKTPSPEQQRPSSIPSGPHVGTSPSSIRVPLTAPAEPLFGVRIAVIDHDLTRADALATTLRAHRVQVYLCSPHLEHFHARLLRKFAPHAIVIDEALLRGPAAELMSLIRKDPFLLHVRLLAVNLSRYFRPRTGATQLDALLPLIKPLAQGEQDLLAKLGPTCEVEFSFDEVPPHLLLKLLVPRSVSTQIECTADGVCLTWTVGWNQAAAAELTQGGQKLFLNPERALDWLLAHHDCRVVIIQRPEREALVGEEVLSLIDKRLAEEPDFVTASHAIPLEVKSHSNSRSVRAQSSSAISLSPPSAEPQSTNRPHAISGWAERIPKNRRAGVLAVSGAIAVAAGIALVFAQVSSGQQALPGEKGATGQDSALGEAHSPIDAHLNPSAQLTEPSLAVIEPSIQAALPEVKATNGAPADTPKSDQVADTAGEINKPSGLLFRIDENQLALDCDEVLGGWVPNPNQPREAGRIYFRQAQKDLVQGENGQAHYKLCQAAVLMPGGAGSLELARYYLGLRAYSLADKHLQTVLDVGDKSVEVQLLHGDLLSQQGQESVSRDIWLTAIQVDAADEAKCLAVSRKYVRDARAALRYLDYALAERYLRRSVTLWRGNREAAAMLAELFKKQGFDAAAQAWNAEARDAR